jgi:hypothetical protein
VLRRKKLAGFFAAAALNDTKKRSNKKTPGFFASL